MNQEQMRNRTKEFAKQIIIFCRQLPENREGRLIGNQIFRSGTSVGSNYRAVCRARSKADFVAKIGLVLEEADETLYWLELIDETEIMVSGALKEIKKEANELVAIFVSTVNKQRHESENFEAISFSHRDSDFVFLQSKIFNLESKIKE
jgi:four helix bundle protein